MTDGQCYEAAGVVLLADGEKPSFMIALLAVAQRPQIVFNVIVCFEGR